MRVDVDHQVAGVLVTGKAEEVLGQRQRLLGRDGLGANAEELLLQLADVHGHDSLRDVLALVEVPEVGELALGVLELVEDGVGADKEDHHLCEGEGDEEAPRGASRGPVAEELQQGQRAAWHKRVLWLLRCCLCGLALALALLLLLLLQHMVRKRLPRGVLEQRRRLHLRPRPRQASGVSDPGGSHEQPCRRGSGAGGAPAADAE